MPGKKLNIFAISGSLKSTSSNTAILREISYMASDQEYFIYDELETLPPFNPDKELGNTAVRQFKERLKRADAVVLSTPEYAFGVPGVLKNALDWTVSSGELNEKPVIAISASPLYEGGSKALASLLLTLSALGTKMDEQSYLSIANSANKIKGGRVTDEQTLLDLKRLLDRLVATSI